MLSVSYVFGDGIPGMAHGFFEEFLGVRTLGHVGSLLNRASSRLTFSPEYNLGFIMVANTDNLTFGPGLATALFGEARHEAYHGTLPNVRNLANLTGWYAPAMRLENRGFMQLLGSIPMPSDRIRIIDENTLAFAGTEFVQFAPFAFRDVAADFQLHLVVENNTVNRVLLVSDTAGVMTAGAVSEFTPLPFINVLGSYVSLLLLAVTALILIDFGVLRAIRRTRKAKKNRKKGLEVIPFTSVEKKVVWLGIAGLAININWLAMVVRANMFSASHSALMPHFILNIAYMVLAPVLSGFVLWSIRKTELPKKSKVFCILSCAATIVFAVLMLAWEFYR
jgi:hypothetical protein